MLQIVQSGVEGRYSLEGSTDGGSCLDHMLVPSGPALSFLNHDVILFVSRLALSRVSGQGHRFFFGAAWAE